MDGTATETGMAGRLGWYSAWNACQRPLEWGGVADGGRRPLLHDIPATFRNPIARLLIAYERLAAAGLPRREDVGLEQLKDLLGWEFFAEWLAPHSIVVRLSGSHIDYVLGANVTGVNFFDKYRADQRALYSRFYGAIADQPCGGYTVRGVVVGGTERFQYHSIYLPLATRPNYVPIVGAVAITDFARLGSGGKVGGAPDFQALSRLGVFDIGFGMPAGAHEPVDIAAVAAAIEAAGNTSLDQEALEGRPLIGRPRSMR